MRDVYLQRRAADIDIATSAPPPRVRSIFSGERMVDLPRSTVKLTHQGEVRKDSKIVKVLRVQKQTVLWALVGFLCWHSGRVVAAKGGALSGSHTQGRYVRNSQEQRC